MIARTGEEFAPQPLTGVWYLLYNVGLMELSPKQQTTELVKKHQKILIITHKNPDGDALGSSLAFAAALKKLAKQVDVVCPDPVPPIFEFLPGREAIKSAVEGAKELLINLNTATVKLDKLGYRSDADGNKVTIVATPQKGSFRKEDVEVVTGSVKYDLVFVLDTSDLDRLGPIFDENSSLFYETPIVNIDHHASNDYFGKVNWVDLTATSTAEILVALIESLSGQTGKNLLDEDITTNLLTGIVTDTDSFQNQNTTPKSLTVAAQLVAAGARKQEIIQKIYKTKPLSTLKLWGAALTRLVEESKTQGGGFVWTHLNLQDYKQAGANEGEQGGLIDEFIKSATGVDFALLLTERDQTVHGSLRAVEKSVDVAAIAREFGGGGHAPAAAFEVPANGSFEETVKGIVEKLKTQ